MTIPHIKQKRLEKMDSEERDRLTSISPISPGLPTTIILVLLASLLLAPSVYAFQRTEGFENIAAGTPPQDNELYTYTSTNSDDRVSIAQAHTGTKSFRYDGIASSNYASFEIADQCGVVDEDEFTFWVYITALPAAGTEYNWRMAAAPDAASGPNNRVELNVADSGAMDVDVENSIGTTSTVVFPATMPVATWVDFRIDSTCSTASGGVFSATLDAGAGTTAGAGVITALDTFTVREGGGGASSPHFLDDFSWEFSEGDIGSRFCADAGESDNFGWDYLEEVVFDTQSPGISMEDFYLFSGSDTDSDYTAKGFSPGSRAFETVFTLEAADEASESWFRVAYTTGAHELIAGSAGDTGADQTAASDGTDGGNFDNNVQVRLIEEGSDWRITIRQNIGGTGLFQLGASVAFGDPNTQNSFIFRIDGRTGSGPIASLYSYGNTEVPIIQRETGFASGQIWKDQWFIGKGGVFGTAETALDNNDSGDTTPSTCIFDLTGESVVTGSAGSTPNNETPDDPSDDEDAGGGGGLANAPDWLFSTIFTYIGALIIGGVVSMLVSGRGGVVVILCIFAFLATIFSIFVWGMPWYIPLLLLVLPSLAIIILKWVDR